MTRTDLDKLISLAKSIQMTPDQIDEQRRSFAWGNTNIENERITKDMVNKAVESAGDQTGKFGQAGH